MPETLTDAARLIRDTWEETAAERGLTAERVVIFNAGDGFLGTEMRALLSGGPGAEITLFERDARLVDAAAMREGLVVPEQPEPSDDASADLVLLLMPKGRAYARRQIIQAHRMLAGSSGGRLWICGPSQRGVKGLVTDAGGVFGAEPEVLAYKHRQRLVEVVRSEVETDPDDKRIKKWWGTEGIMPGTTNRFEAAIAGQTLGFETTAGVFSWEHLDEGTRILLEQMGEATLSSGGESWRGQVVGDVGCGVGVLGVAAAKLGAQLVAMNDVDRHAVACAEKNAAANGVLEACRVVAADNLMMSIDGSVMLDGYDRIVSNPAFHRGEEVDYAMAQELAARAGHALKAGGQLWVVANRFLAYHRYLNPVFGKENVSKAYEDNKFVVFVATRPEELPAIDEESVSGGDDVA